MKNFKIKMKLKNGTVFIDTIKSSLPGAALILFVEKNMLQTDEFTAISITIEKD